MTDSTLLGRPCCAGTGKFLVRLAGFLFLAATFAVLSNMGHIHTALHNIEIARSWILKHGLLETSLVFFAINTLLCAFGCPRLWTSVFAGAVFGGAVGFLVSLPSSILGTCLTFAVGRLLGAGRILPHINAKWKGSVSLPTPPDFLKTVLIRQLPIPGIILTLLLSASGISSGVFVAGSTLGFIPGAALACFLGDTATTQKTQSELALAAVIILIGVGIIALLRRNSRMKAH